MNANDIQHGGDHYKNSEGVQHWDWVTLNLGTAYLVGCATKYMSRWRNKNGLEDLEKAKHYTDKLIELVRSHNLINPLLPQGGILSANYIPTSELKAAYDLTGDETRFCHLLLHWCGVQALEEASAIAGAMIGIERLKVQAQEAEEPLFKEPLQLKETDRVEDLHTFGPAEAAQLISEITGIDVDDLELVEATPEGLHFTTKADFVPMTGNPEAHIYQDGMEHPFGYDADEECGCGDVIDDDDDFVIEDDVVFKSSRNRVGELETQEDVAGPGATIINVEGDLIISCKGGDA